MAKLIKKILKILEKLLPGINPFDYKVKNLKHSTKDMITHQLNFDLVCKKGNCNGMPKCNAEVIVKLTDFKLKVKEAKIVCGDKTITYP